MNKQGNFIDLGGERAVAIGRYVAESGDTVRGAAKIFGVSKSTAHKDLTVKLKSENLTLYRQVATVLEKNKRERHIRGGLATRDKYIHLKSAQGKNKLK
ncbi:MAG: sporulation transcriptional regulator SpoIIID [Oscillospiraceae bacterium]